jgi:hypothetical protein
MGRAHKWKWLGQIAKGNNVEFRPSPHETVKAKGDNGWRLSRPVQKHHFSRDGVVGMVNRYGLDGLGIEPRCGRDFQIDPETHPEFCKIETESLSRG